MPETLTKKRNRRVKVPDPRERELKRLKLSVCDDTGFRLLLATYDQPKRRDELIEQVVQEAKGEKVRVTRLDLAAGGPETNLVGLLRAHLASSDPTSGWRRAVMVTGIEQRIDYSSGNEGFAFLHQANLLRDALPEAAPVPVVLWLSRLASAALPAEAPDLWHWRAANFDFTGDEAPRLELLRELTALRPQDEDGMSGEQRRARIQMLEDLLAELERQGPPNSKRQTAERASLLGQLGQMYLYVDRRKEAWSAFDRQLLLAREINDQTEERAALRNLGNYHLSDFYDLDAHFWALESYQEALKISREIGDRRAECLALFDVAEAYSYLQSYCEEIECLNRSLLIARAIGDRRSEGRALRSLADVWRFLDEPSKAIEHLRPHLEIARAIGDPREEMTTLNSLGFAYAALGERRQAINYFDQELAIARAIRDRWRESDILVSLGSLYAFLGEPRALKYLGQSLAIARDINYKSGEGNALYNTALAYDQLGDRGEAIRRMTEVSEVFEGIRSRWGSEALAKLAEWEGKGYEI